MLVYFGKLGRICAEYVLAENVYLWTAPLGKSLRHCQLAKDVSFTVKTVGLQLAHPTASWAAPKRSMTDNGNEPVPDNSMVSSPVYH